MRCCSCRAGIASPLAPLLYAVAGLIGAFAERKAAPRLLLCALGLSAALYFGTEGQRELAPFLLHALLFGCSAC